MCHLLHSFDESHPSSPPGFETYFASPSFFFPQDHFWHRGIHDYGSSQLGDYRYGSVIQDNAVQTNLARIGLVASQMIVKDAVEGDMYEYRIPDHMSYKEGLHGYFDLKRAPASRIAYDASPSTERSTAIEHNLLRPSLAKNSEHISVEQKTNAVVGRGKLHMVSDLGKTHVSDIGPIEYYRPSLTRRLPDGGNFYQQRTSPNAGHGK